MLILNYSNLLDIKSDSPLTAEERHLVPGKALRLSKLRKSKFTGEHSQIILLLQVFYVEWGSKLELQEYFLFK